jgi:hypothetical protein
MNQKEKLFRTSLFGLYVRFYKFVLSAICLCQSSLLIGQETYARSYTSNTINEKIYVNDELILSNDSSFIWTTLKRLKPGWNSFDSSSSGGSWSIIKKGYIRITLKKDVSGNPTQILCLLKKRGFLLFIDCASLKKLKLTNNKKWHLKKSKS